jgi:methylglutaconyl-CoA hydratase
MTQFIRQASAGKCATITLARPDLHNAFNDEMIREITAAFSSLAAAPKVRAVVLSGEGKSFCAGADVNWMKRMVGYSFEENVADANLLAAMLRSIRECPKPVIARVHGAAYGGGVGLVAACDMAVALANATFCLSEVKLGIVPAVISPFVLEKIGAGAARRYALTAERFDAAEAKRIGLVSEVVDNDQQMNAWIERIIEHVMANGPEAIATCKQVLAHVAGDKWDELQAYTTRQIARIRVSPEGQEGLKAFLEKRKPGWAG